MVLSEAILVGIDKEMDSEEPYQSAIEDFFKKFTKGWRYGAVRVRVMS